MNFLIKSPKTKKDFNLYYNLRWEILRKPYDQKKGSEKDANELVSHHLMAYLPNNKVIGVGRINEDKNKKAQIRFMAVHSKYRNNNVGEKILKELEKYAYKNSIEYIYLNARDSAVKFYLKNGYKIIKKSHVLFGNLHHWLMEKNIIK